MGVQERLTLEAVSAHTVIATEHLHRYEFAAGLCEGDRVLDLACGSGYGSRILRQRAVAVTAVDNDAATIDMARETIGREADVTFEAADATEYLRSRAVDDFDAIVCFEGIEHLPDPERALDELRRFAEAGAKVIISLPNSRAFDEKNEFHVTNYGFEGAMRAFDRFPDRVVLYQFLAEGSLIRAEAGTRELEARIELESHGEPQYANHFICCANCGDSFAASGRMELTAAPLHNSYVLHLERSVREMWQTNAKLARQKLGVHDSAAATLVTRYEELQHRLEQAEAEVELIKAWYDAPRYHLVDKVRKVLLATGVHGLLKRLLRLGSRLR